MLGAGCRMPYVGCWSSVMWRRASELDTPSSTLIIDTIRVDALIAPLTGRVLSPSAVRPATDPWQACPLRRALKGRMWHAAYYTPSRIPVFVRHCLLLMRYSLPSPSSRRPSPAPNPRYQCFSPSPGPTMHDARCTMRTWHPQMLSVTVRYRCHVLSMHE